MSERGYYANHLRDARYNISVPHQTLAPQRDPGHPNSHWDAPPSRLIVATKIYTSFGLIYIYIYFMGEQFTLHIICWFFLEQPEIILGRYQHSKPHMSLWGKPRLTPADPSAHQEHPEFQPKHSVDQDVFDSVYSKVFVGGISKPPVFWDPLVVREVGIQHHPIIPQHLPNLSSATWSWRWNISFLTFLPFMNATEGAFNKSICWGVKLNV